MDNPVDRERSWSRYPSFILKMEKEYEAMNCLCGCGKWIQINTDPETDDVEIMMLPSKDAIVTTRDTLKRFINDALYEDELKTRRKNGKL